MCFLVIENLLISKHEKTIDERLNAKPAVSKGKKQKMYFYGKKNTSKIEDEFMNYMLTSKSK